MPAGVLDFLTEPGDWFWDWILSEIVSVSFGRQQIHEVGGSSVQIDRLSGFDSLNSI
jgi:hypothetical protein